MFKFNFTEEISTDIAVVKPEHSEIIKPLVFHCTAERQSNEDGDTVKLNYSFGSLFYILNTSSKCDLQDGLYEGGNVVWECTIDLLNCFEQSNIMFNDKSVLDMGCGQGLIGTYCLKKNAKSVHFTDYNADVIEKSLFHTLHINDVNLSMVTASSGDWSAFAEVVTEKFDYIVTSETIYNESYYPKLHAALKKASSSDTIIYIAAKSHYFGCGGSVFGWTQFIEQENYFSYSNVWCSDSNQLQRNIIKMWLK